jgi:hypothetical protein
MDPPPNWQGASLLENDGDRRAYLFSADGNFTLGVVDDQSKFIYDFNRDRPELYNLADDPGEHRNLAFDRAHSAELARDHLRLEAWLSFQNAFLKSFTGAPIKLDRSAAGSEAMSQQ